MHASRKRNHVDEVWMGYLKIIFIFIARGLRIRARASRKRNHVDEMWMGYLKIIIIFIVRRLQIHARASRKRNHVDEMWMNYLNIIFINLRMGGRSCDDPPCAFRTQFTPSCQFRLSAARACQHPCTRTLLASRMHALRACAFPAE